MKTFSICLFTLFYTIFNLHYKKDFTSSSNKPKNGSSQILKFLESADYDEYFYHAKVDHFNMANNQTFPLRYLVKDKYFKLGGPILFHCGNEGPITVFWDNSGFQHEDLAKRFNALVIFAEHRFFGKSFPIGDHQDHDIQKNQYLTVEQAMADYVDLITWFKETNGHINSPVIAFGGSYGGMLSSWSRMKFPHVYAGAIASSAPILLFENIDKIQNSFFKIVTETYRRYDSMCPVRIREGFNFLRNNGTTSDKYGVLNEIFRPCSPVNSTADVAKLENTIEEALVALAQYNFPYPTSFLAPTPATPVKVSCERIAANNNDDNNDYIRNGLSNLKAAIDVFFNYTGNQHCLDIGNGNEVKPNNTDEFNGWSYLACTEMIMPMEKNGVTDMFNPEKWNETDFKAKCQKEFNADFRPKWAFNYFGGRNFEKEILEYSNIYFINGSMDPWNAGCPQSSNGNPKVEVILADSAHHLDLRRPHKDDPESIVRARNRTIELIEEWIK